MTDWINSQPNSGFFKLVKYTTTDVFHALTDYFILFRNLNPKEFHKLSILANDTSEKCCNADFHDKYLDPYKNKVVALRSILYVNTTVLEEAHYIHDEVTLQTPDTFIYRDVYY